MALIPKGAPAPTLYTPATNQAAVKHIKLTVLSVHPQPPHTLRLEVRCGMVAFPIGLPLPGAPAFHPGDQLVMEYPAAQNPLDCKLTAIYHAQHQPPRIEEKPAMQQNQIALIPGNDETVTMTSLQLVDFINDQRKEGEAELRHADFMAKVPKVLGEEISEKFRSSYFDSMNRKKPCYTFPKREACLMAMSYSYELQAQVFDHMTALEKKLELQHQPKRKPAVKTQPDPLKATVTAARALPQLVKVCQFLGLDKNAAIISANQTIYQATQINVMQQLGVTHLEAENQDSQWYTPTELGQMMGTSARGLNLLLAESGLQAKMGEKWEATEVGKEFSRLLDTGKRHGNGTPITQLKWSRHVIPMLGEQREAM